jgi:hypothetical protein
MGDNKGEHWEEDYQGQVGWNDHGGHVKGGILGDYQKQIGVWRG